MDTEYFPTPDGALLDDTTDSDERVPVPKTAIVDYANTVGEMSIA